MIKFKVTLGKYWVEAFCCYFFGIKLLKPCGFHLRRFFRPGRCNSVWKTGWFVSMFMSIGWDSSFGIPILYRQVIVIRPVRSTPRCQTRHLLPPDTLIVYYFFSIYPEIGVIIVKSKSLSQYKSIQKSSLVTTDGLASCLSIYVARFANNTTVINKLIKLSMNIEYINNLFF